MYADTNLWEQVYTQTPRQASQLGNNYIFRQHKTEIKDQQSAVIQLILQKTFVLFFLNSWFYSFSPF